MKTCENCRIGWHESDPHEVKSGSEPYTHTESHVEMCPKHAAVDDLESLITGMVGYLLANGHSGHEETIEGRMIKHSLELLATLKGKP